MTQADIAID